MTEHLPYLSAFMIGLLGSTHCVGMCGGIMGALTFSLPQQSGTKQAIALLLFNCGRIASYTLIGAALGGLAGVASSNVASIAPVLRTLTGIMMILLGLYITGWWQILAHLERLGGNLWQKISRITKALTPVDSAGKALIIGALWGWLPCGLVYSTLVWSMASANSVQAGLMMFFFGMGTLPALIATALLAQPIKAFLQKRQLRRIAGILMILFGLLTLMQWAPGHQAHNAHEDKSHHLHPSNTH